MTQTTFNTALDEFGESLKELDELLKEFRGHPMIDEWLDADEVTVMSSIYEDDDEDDEGAYEGLFLDWIEEE